MRLGLLSARESLAGLQPAMVYVSFPRKRESRDYPESDLDSRFRGNDTMQDRGAACDKSLFVTSPDPE